MIHAAAILAAALAQAGPGTWDQPARAGTTPVTEANGATALLDNTNLYVLNGWAYATFHRYNLKTGLWTRLADPPIIGGEGSCLAAANGKIWAFFGYGLTTFHSFDPATGAWSAPLAPIPTPVTGGAMTAIGSVIYTIPGAQYGPEPRAPSDTFYSYDTKAASPGWTRLPDLPFSPGWYGVCMTAVGSDIYATTGGMPMVWRYRDGAWNEDPIYTFDITKFPDDWEYAGFSAGIGASMTSDGSRLLLHTGSSWLTGGSKMAPSMIHSFDGTAWKKFLAVPANVQPASGFSFTAGLEYASDTKRLYFLRGGNTTDLWTWDLSGETPAMLATDVPASPVTLPPLRAGTSTLPRLVDRGGSMTGGAGRLYALQGFGTKTFASFDPATNAWSTLPDLPQPIGGSSTGYWDGGAIVHDGARLLYVVGNGSNFYRYDTWAGASGTWESLPAVPAGMKPSAYSRLVHVPADPGREIEESIFMLLADGSKTLVRYNVATGAWTSVTPSEVEYPEGSTMVHPAGSGRLYILSAKRRNSYETYARNDLFGVYDIAGDEWAGIGDSAVIVSPADPPETALAGIGTVLCHPDSGKHLYAVFTGPDPATGVTGLSRFYSYQLPETGEGSDRWTPLASGAYTFHSGASLAYPGSGPHLYAMPGNGTAILMRYELVNTGPSVGTLAQFRADGKTPLPAGGSVFDGTWHAGLKAEDPDGDAVDIEIEIRRPGGDYVPAGRARRPSGSAVTVPLTLPGPGEYEWRARIADARGVSTGYIEYGSGTPFDIRYRTTDALPEISPVVKDGGSDRIIPPGGSVSYDTFSVRVAAVMDDPDGLGDRARIDAAIVDPKTGSVLYTSSGDFAAPGEESSALFRIEIVGGYAVHYRVTDEWDFSSAWMSLGDDQADFNVLPNGSAGDGKVCGASAGILAAWPGILLLALLLRR